MLRKNTNFILSLLTAGRTLAAPLAAQVGVGNSTSSRISTTIFWTPHASTPTGSLVSFSSSEIVVTSEVGPPVSASSPSSSPQGPSTVTIPWSPTSSQSVHVITITSPWPTVTPTVTVSAPIPTSATPSPVRSSQASPTTTPQPPAVPGVLTLTTTAEPTTVTLAPEVVTVTASPEYPVPAVVTVIDTTVTVYISSGILTVLPTITVTASAPKTADQSDIILITDG